MQTLTVVCDAQVALGTDLATALEQRAPVDFRVSVVSPDSLVPGRGGDLVLLAPGVAAAALTQELRDNGYAGAIVVVWPHSWPREIEHFHAAYREADAVILNDPVYWDRLGGLPGTHTLSHAVELKPLAAQGSTAERPRRVLLGRDPYPSAGRSGDRLLDEEARWSIGELGMLVEGPPEIRGATDLRSWLDTGAVLVVWDDDLDSRRALLAAAADGCPVVCTPEALIPGLIEDGASACVAEPEPLALRMAVERALQCRGEVTDTLSRRIAEWSWDHRAAEYYSLARQLLRHHPRSAEAARRPALDLTGEVTVFVTTVGAPSYAACLNHLEAQDCSFRLHVIDHVAPMSAAFQRMLDGCTTPYYVQVDEDMLLYPQAVRTLYERIRTAAPETTLVVGYLLDAHLGAPIQGVKIFRHAVAARYPYEDRGSFELTQIERMRPDGYTYDVVPLAADWPASAIAGGILGLHGTHWTPLAIFERYATLERARHQFPKNQRWLRQWPARFLDRVLSGGSELDLFALMGIIAGRVAQGDADAAKDFRRYRDLAGFAGIRAFVDALCGPDP